MSDLLNFEEAMAELGLGRDELENLAASGELRGIHEDGEIRFKAEEVAALQQSWFPDVAPLALRQCIATYQQLGCWTPHVEITPQALEVTLDVFEYTGGIGERYAYDQVCAPPPAV